MDTKVYTVEEISKILNIGKNKTYELLHQKVIPYIRLGRKYRIPKKAFEEWLASNDKVIL